MLATAFRRMARGLALGMFAASLGSLGAQAQQLPQTTLRAVAYTSNLYMWTDVEKEFYERTIPQASGGRVRIEAMPHDLAGMRGPEILSLLQNGTLQIAIANLSYMAGDDPRFEAIDLAGLAITVDEARRATDAYRGVLDRRMRERFNTRLLGVAPLPSQIFWCRQALTGLSDLRGRKVRVFNATLADFMTGVGGTTVTMPFVEVIPALQRGIADCAVTGTTSGFAARWPEVTTHLYPMTVGWSMVFWGINNDVYNRLPQPVQKFIDEQYAAIERIGWERQAYFDREGISCATGGACNIGTPASMTLVPVSERDQAERTRILQSSVLPNWARRCGRACAEEFNATIGAALGTTAPLP